MGDHDWQITDREYDATYFECQQCRATTHRKSGLPPSTPEDCAKEGLAPCGLGAVARPGQRPTHQEVCMRFAHLIAQRSTCLRLQVGCVVASADFRKIISMGYNGNATGLPNTCDSPEPGACGCLHAECNAVVNCDSPRGTPKIVFVTHLPCKMCAKMIVNLGDVQKLYYATDYRVRDGLFVLERAGIHYARLEV